jgi:hypothetical protein
MKTISAWIHAHIEVPDDLEERMRGGPEGDADNTEALEEFRAGVQAGRFRLSDVTTDNLEPVS